MSSSNFHTRAPMGTRANVPSVISYQESRNLESSPLPHVERRKAERIRGGCMLCPGGGIVVLDCFSCSGNFQDDKMEESQQPQPMQPLRPSQIPQPSSHLRPPSPDQRPPSRGSRLAPSCLSGQTAVEWRSPMQYVRSLWRRCRIRTPYNPRGGDEAGGRQQDSSRRLPFRRLRDCVKDQLEKYGLHIVWK